MKSEWQKTVEDIISNHEERIRTLEKRKKSNMPKWFYDWNEMHFNPLVAKVDNLEKDVKILKTDVQVLKKDVEVLKKDVDVLKTQVNKLNKEVGILNKEVFKSSK